MSGNSVNNILINKNVIERMLKYVDSSSCKLEVVDINTISLTKQEFTRIRNIFGMTISKDLIKSVSSIKYADIDKLNQLFDTYISIKYNDIRNKFNQEKGISYTEEEIIELGLKVLDKVDDIKKIPKIINDIDDRILEINKSDIPSSIKDIEKEYESLKLKGSSLQEYKTIKTFLDIILRKTYLNNITKLSSNDINNKEDIYLVVSEDNKEYLLTKENVDMFSYGLILDPENIICAHDETDKKNKFLSFKNIDKKSNEVIIEEKRPSAIYAVTIGERALNNNYKEAIKLLEKYPNIPLIEIDLTKYLSSENMKEYIEQFIDEMLEEKNVNFENKDERFYEKFDDFYNDFCLLKAKAFNENNIINLFEHSYNLLFDSKYNNLDNVFTNFLMEDEIKTILKKHKDHEAFIFRYKLITYDMLRRFYEKYYDYRSDQIFNRLYPGIFEILSYIQNSAKERLHEIVELYNNSKEKDSWYISNIIDPKHKINKAELKIQEEAKSIQEYDGSQEFVDFLKSNDEDKRVRE